LNQIECPFFTILILEVNLVFVFKGDLLTVCAGLNEDNHLFHVVILEYDRLVSVILKLNDSSVDVV